MHLSARHRSCHGVVGEWYRFAEPEPVPSRQRPNNRMQRTALRAAVDAERWAARLAAHEHWLTHFRTRLSHST